MSLLKYIYRLKRMDDLIRRKATGSPEKFAEKLGLHRSVLMENLNEMRELGAKISYCHFRKSYYYEDEFHLFIGNNKKEIDGNKIKGGELYYLNFDLVIPL